MKSVFEDRMTKEQLELRGRLLSVIKESDMPLEKSWQVLSYLSDEFRHARDRCDELFTMKEIWNKYEAKLSQTNK